jgi:hypothetical protein
LFGVELLNNREKVVENRRYNMSILDENESPFNDIESRLDSIESQLSTIENKVDKLPNSIIWFMVFLIWAAVFFMGDFSCSIPAHKPYKLKTESYSGIEVFKIIYDEFFTGEATYFQDSKSVKFNIRYVGKSSINLKDAKLYLFTKDKYRYELILNDFYNQSLQKESPILNPYSEIIIDALMPPNLPPINNIEGFKIETKGGKDIRFGYKNLSWIDELRWWLADNYRKD